MANFWESEGQGGEFAALAPWSSMTRVRGAGGGLISFGFVVACAVALVLLVKGLYPADLPQSHNPDFVDNVFDSRAVLWAARLLLISAAAVLAFGGVFIVVSIGVRMKNREWLRRAGPFEISGGSLGQTEEELEFWRGAASKSQEETARLREQARRWRELLGEHDELL